MAHHSSDLPMGIPEELVDALRDKRELLGPTNRMPEAKLAPHDEGELRFAVGVQKDAAGIPKVVIDFGSPVHSLGLTKAQACELGRLLITRAGHRCTVHLD